MFDAVEEKLIADMWPIGLPRMAKDIKSQHQWKARDIVPSNLEHLHKWAYVTRNPENGDPTRRHVLVYTVNGDDDDAGPLQVAFRVQGFVQKLNIKPTGNWNM